jgi:hypothetical protein
MRSFRFLPVLIVTCFLLITCLPASSQFVTLARKIKSKHTATAVESTVVLDAHTYKVYQAVIDTLNSSPKLRVIQRDDSKRTIEFSSGENALTLKVDSLDKKVCRITVNSPAKNKTAPGEEQLTVKAIMAVCAKLGIKCSIEEK